MAALTAKERASRFRLARSAERTVEKLSRLVDSAPAGFEFPPEVELGLISALEKLVGVPVEFVEVDGRVGFQLLLDQAHGSVELNEGSKLSWSTGLSEYWSWKATELERAAMDKQQKGMTRNAFCTQILGAQLANPRWGWVGVKEQQNGQPGTLYIFAWEHNRKHDGPETVRLFESAVGTGASGRRNAGHRDALEKIQRVLAGELVPYIVWLRAVDPDATPRSILSINCDFVQRCELYIDDHGYWTGRLLEVETISPMPMESGG